MDLQLSTSYLKAKVVHSCMIKYTPTKKIVRKPFWSLDRDEISQEDGWTLEICYVREDDTQWTYTQSSKDHATLKAQFESVMKQIRDQDSQFTNRLLEEAIINGGSK